MLALITDMIDLDESNRDALDADHSGIGLVLSQATSSSDYFGVWPASNVLLCWQLSYR